MTRKAAIYLLPLCAVMTEPAMAQTADDQASATAAEQYQSPDVIVVSARRRDEKLIDVPISITAYSGEALEGQGALDLTDIATTTPNVTLEPVRNSSSIIAAFIRGVGQQDPLPGLEAGVGIYVDDVYLNRPQGALLDIYDVQRIEVLRGPQGTLYGRNTIGGAVKYVTRRLSDEPELRVRANLGTHEQADGIVTASAPVGDGLFRVGGTFARLSRGGFGKNLTNGRENYNKNIWAGRLSAEINNEDNVFIRLSGDYTRDESNLPGMHRLIPGYLSGAPVLDNPFDTRAGNVTPEPLSKAYGTSLFAEIGISDTSKIRSITAYRRDTTYFPNDSDALATIESDTEVIYRNRQFSQELQYVLESDRLSGVLGAYYLNARAEQDGEGSRLFTTVPGLISQTLVTMRTETFALFGDASYNVTPQVSISVGGRYTWDTRKADILSHSSINGTFFPPSSDFDGKKTFKQFTPRASISFEPDDNNHIYATYSKGFKGGSFDPRGKSTQAPDLNNDGTIEQSEYIDFLTFDPEIVDSYEIGYKGSLLDNRVYLALAAFRMDYSNVQIPGIRACDVGGVTSFCGITTNAGKARIQGFEMESNIQLARDLMAGGDKLIFSNSLGYVDAKFKKYITNIGGVATDVSHLRKVQNTPKWTASGTVRYETPAGGGRISIDTTVAYRSKVYQYEVPNPLIDQKGYALWHANINYTSADDRWKIGLHAKNILDKEYRTSGYSFLQADPLTGALLVDPDTGRYIPQFGQEGILVANYGPPRQVFVSFEYNF